MNRTYNADIKVRRETREKLRKCGLKGETYDEIINKLVDTYFSN